MAHGSREAGAHEQPGGEAVPDGPHRARGDQQFPTAAGGTPGLPAPSPGLLPPTVPAPL